MKFKGIQKSGKYRCYFYILFSSFISLTVQAKSDTIVAKTPSIDTLGIVAKHKTKKAYLPQQTRSFKQLLPARSNVKTITDAERMNQLYQQKLATIDTSKQKEAEKIHSLHDFVKKNNFLVKSLNLAAPIQLPVGIRRGDGNAEYIVLIDSLAMDANGIATVGAYLSFTTPQGKKIAFKGYMQVSAEGGLVGESRLELLVDMPMKFSKGVLLNIKSAGTYAVVDCNGFKEMGLKGELTFTNLVKDKADGTPGTQPIVTSFETAIKSWNDLIVKIDLPDFQIKGVKGLGFKVEEAVFDFSDSRNALNFSFPQNYNASWLPEPNSPVWQGIYLRSFKVALPRYLKKKDGSGNSEQLRNRITFLGKDIVLDATGFSGKVTVDKLISRKQGNLDGWAFSIDHLGFGFQANTLKFFEIKGQINLPIAKDEADSYLNYRAMIDFYNDEFLFGAGTNKPIKVPMLGDGSTLELTQAYLEAKVSKGNIEPKAILSGKFSIKNKVLNIEQIRFEGIKITRSGISNFDKVDVRFGKKSAGKFPIQITEFGVVTKQDIELGDSTQAFANSRQQDEVGYLGLRMGVQVNFTKELSGTGYITLISAQVEKEGNHRWRYKDTQINGVKIDIDQGPYMFRGLLRFYKDDKIYGNGFNGQIALGISMGGGKGFGMQANVIFGKVNGFRYWYADALVAFAPGIPLGPTGLSIYGFGGGLYYRMRKKVGTTTVAARDMGHTSSGAVYLPDKNAGIGLKATVVIGFAKSLKPFYGDVTFEMAFNRGGGVRYIGFAGYGYFLNKQKKITVKDFVKAPEDKRKNAPISAGMVIDYDLENQVFHLVADVQININSGAAKMKGGGQMVMHFAPDEWYVHIGTPEKRIGVEAVVAGISVKTGLYLMTGTAVPEIPPPPAKVLEILGMGAQVDARDDDNVFSGKGFAIGFSLEIKREFRAFVYFKAHIGLGFDISYKKYAEHISCKGRPGPVGVNGWLGQGQTYLFAEGGLGVRFKGRDYPFMSVSAALLAQIQFFKPFWAKGILGGRFNILGGLVKGRFKLSVEVGQRCELVANGSGASALLAEVKVISDIKPTAAEGVANVFTAPQVTFNMPIGVPFEMEDEQGNPIGFRAKLNKFNIVAAGQKLAGTLHWNDSKDVVLLHTNEVLPSNTQISVEVQLVFEEKKGGAWLPVMEGRQPYTETKTETFQSGEAPPYIPLFNIAASYPVINQMHMHKDEVGQGFIQLHSGQNYLFDPAQNKEWAGQKLRWINKATGEVTESGFTYLASQKRLVFDIDKGLKTTTIYQVDLVNVPQQTASRVDANVRNDAKTVVAGADTLTFANKKITGSQKNYQEQSLLDPQGVYFRTSKYATLAMKIQSLRFKQAFLSVVAPYVDKMMSYIEGDELFDQAELEGLAIKRGRFQYTVAPLIQIEADLPNTDWYQRGLYPKIYAGYPYGSGVEITSRNVQPYGIPPARAVRLLQYSESKMLSPDQLVYPGTSSSWLHILYDIAHYAEQDMRDLQLRIAIANTHGTPMTAMFRTILGSRFPAMNYGTYPLKLRYVLPGKKKQVTSTTDLLIRTTNTSKK